MKVIANKPGMEDAKRHISYLEQCKSFYELKQACSDKGDIENNDNIVVYNMGRNNVNTMLYAFGFFQIMLILLIMSCICTKALLIQAQGCKDTGQNRSLNSFNVI